MFRHPRTGLLITLFLLTTLVVLRMFRGHFPKDKVMEEEEQWTITYPNISTTSSPTQTSTPTTSSLTWMNIPITQHLVPSSLASKYGTSYSSISSLQQHRSKFLFKHVCFDPSTMEVVIFADSDAFLAQWRSIPYNTMESFSTKYRRLNSTAWFEWAPKLGYVPEKNVLYYNNGMLAKKSSSPNPAHCMSDVLFSLFVEGPQVVRTFDLYLHRTDPGEICDTTRDWCCFMFERQGIFQATETVKSGYCFENLWIPHFSVGRFAIDFQNLPPFVARTSKYWYYEDPRHNDRLRGYLDQTPGSFPISSLIEMNHRAIHGYFRTNSSITNTQVDLWRKQRPPTKQRKQTILIVSRDGDNRRTWLNAGEFVKELLSRYSNVSGGESPAAVMLMGAEWNLMLPIDQARLFNLADIVISPHGAALSNLIFARPNRTTVIELSCAIRSTLEDETFVLRHFSWFGTFAHRLGMKVLFYATDAGANECDYMKKGFHVDGKGLFEYMQDRGVFN